MLALDLESSLGGGEAALSIPVDIIAIQGGRRVVPGREGKDTDR